MVRSHLGLILEVGAAISGGVIAPGVKERRGSAFLAARGAGAQVETPLLSCKAAGSPRSFDQRRTMRVDDQRQGAMSRTVRSCTVASRRGCHISPQRGE